MSKRSSRHHRALSEEEGSDHELEGLREVRCARHAQPRMLWCAQPAAGRSWQRQWRPRQHWGRCLAGGSAAEGGLPAAPRACLSQSHISFGLQGGRNGERERRRVDPVIKEASAAG
jgi:hypothetical protein